jgi:hypothetical protein
MADCFADYNSFPSNKINFFKVVPMQKMFYTLKVFLSWDEFIAALWPF